MKNSVRVMWGVSVKVSVRVTWSVSVKDSVMVTWSVRPRTHNRFPRQNPSRNLVAELFCRGKRSCVCFSSRKLSWNSMRKKENKFSFSSSGVSRNTFVCILRNPCMLRIKYETGAHLR